MNKNKTRAFFTREPYPITEEADILSALVQVREIKAKLAQDFTKDNVQAALAQVREIKASFAKKVAAGTPDAPAAKVREETSITAVEVLQTSRAVPQP